MLGEGDIMDTKAALENRLGRIEAQIQDIKARLPAHSTKPPLMIALFDLEDQREVVLAQLKDLYKKA